MMVSTTCTIKGDDETREQADEVVITMGEGVQVSVHSKTAPTQDPTPVKMDYPKTCQTREILGKGRSKSR